MNRRQVLELGAAFAVVGVASWLGMEGAGSGDEAKPPLAGKATPKATPSRTPDQTPSSTPQKPVATPTRPAGKKYIHNVDSCGRKWKLESDSPTPPAVPECGMAALPPRSRSFVARLAGERR